MTGGADLAAEVAQLETLDLEALRALWRQRAAAGSACARPSSCGCCWPGGCRLTSTAASTRRPGAGFAFGAGCRPRSGARGRRAAAPGVARQDRRGGGRGGGLPLGGAALPEPLRRGHRDRRHALERTAVLRAAGGQRDDPAGQALRALHPQELRGGAGAGLQQPRRPARGLRRLREEPGQRRLAGARDPLRRWRLLGRLDGAAGAEAAAGRHRRRQGRRGGGLQDRPADPLARRLRAHRRAASTGTRSASSASPRRSTPPAAWAG